MAYLINILYINSKETTLLCSKIDTPPKFFYRTTEDMTKSYQTRLTTRLKNNLLFAHKINEQTLFITLILLNPLLILHSYGGLTCFILCCLCLSSASSFVSYPVFIRFRHSKQARPVSSGSKVMCSTTPSSIIREYLYKLQILLLCSKYYSL